MTGWKRRSSGRGVLLGVLAVLGKRRRAYHLYLAAREGGFEDVRGVHRTLRVPRADDAVYLVYHQDDVPETLYLVYETLHAALELSAELRSRDERREVKKVYLLAFQLVRHVTVDDALREALRYGGLADARLADETGVVLLTAVEYLRDALYLGLSADYAVKLSLGGLAGEGYAV